MAEQIATPPTPAETYLSAQLKATQKDLKAIQKELGITKSRARTPWIMLVLFGVLAVLACLAIAGGLMTKTADPLTQGDPSIRAVKLLQLESWGGAKPRPGELILALVLMTSAITAMFVGSRKQSAYDGEPASKSDLSFAPGEDSYMHNAHRLLHVKKTRAAFALFRRDVGPLSFDVATHHDRAEVTEYRGLLHWHRDVIEKLLSVFLVCVFCLFLAKGCGYLYDILVGQMWRLAYIAIDICILMTIAGFALILDGMMLVAAMTDAPGIGRTLDSLIVVLAGVAVLMVDAQPGKQSLVTFSLGENPTLAPILAGAIGVLFVVRWVIRHHTWGDFKGENSAPVDPDPTAAPALALTPGSVPAPAAAPAPAAPAPGLGPAPAAPQ